MTLQAAKGTAYGAGVFLVLSAVFLAFVGPFVYIGLRVCLAVLKTYAKRNDLEFTESMISAIENMIVTIEERLAEDSENN